MSVIDIFCGNGKKERKKKEKKNHIQVNLKIIKIHI